VNRDQAYEAFEDHHAAAMHWTGRAEHLAETDGIPNDDVLAVPAVSQAHATLALAAATIATR
jgi:hypothetical protein